MRPLAVIIPSRTITNALACVKAVRQHEPTARIILVDDGLQFNSVELRESLAKDADIIEGQKPFNYSVNNNLGIMAAGNDDVVLLNDDALLKTLGGFSILQYAAEDNPDFGVIAATTNNVGNPNQKPKGRGLRTDPRMCCFVCVLIPRRTIESVGLLDIEFTHYGFQDDSYCLRVRRAGMKIGIHDSCFVDHATLKSTYRELAPTASATYGNGMQDFIKKWGSYPL